MRTLGSAILGLECIVLLLAIPVGLALSDRGAVVGWVFGALAVLAIVAAGLMRRDPETAVVLGWVLQGLAIATGVLIPVMFFVGAMFALVWWSGVHFGRKVDELEAARANHPT